MMFWKIALVSQKQCVWLLCIMRVLNSRNTNTAVRKLTPLCTEQELLGTLLFTAGQG